MKVPGPSDFGMNCCVVVLYSHCFERFILEHNVCEHQLYIVQVQKMLRKRNIIGLTLRTMAP